MVRSAERARVAFPVRVSGRVRLVKHVVTEEVTRTFTVRREELRVEQEPGDASGADLSWTYQLPDDDRERDFEVILHAEQLLVSTEIVPVERVRVSTRVIEKDVVVSTGLRTEQVAFEQVAPGQDAFEQDRSYDRDEHHSRTGSAAGGTPRSEETPA